MIAALVLWVYLERGRRDGREARGRDAELAERLAAEGDEPSAELSARLRDPATLALEYSSGLASS